MPFFFGGGGLGVQISIGGGVGEFCSPLFLSFPVQGRVGGRLYWIILCWVYLSWAPALSPHKTVSPSPPLPRRTLNWINIKWSSQDYCDGGTLQDQVVQAKEVVCVTHALEVVAENSLDYYYYYYLSHTLQWTVKSANHISLQVYDIWQ